MMRFRIQFILVSILVSPVWSAESREGAAAESDEAKAELFLNEFLTVSVLDQLAYSCICRGKAWDIRSNDVRDIIVVKAEVPAKERRSFFATGSTGSANRLQRDWEQFLWNNNRVYARRGAATANSRDVFRYVDQTDYRDLIRGRLQTVFDPQLVPLAPTSEFMRAAQTIDLHYFESLLLINSDFEGAYRDKKNQLVGVWKITKGRGSFVDVTFSRTNHKPILVMWRTIPKGMLNTDWEEREKLEIFAIVQTEWKQYQANNARPWLPRTITMSQVN